VRKGRSVLGGRRLEGKCGRDGEFLLGGFSRKDAEGTECSCWEESRGMVRKGRSVLVGRSLEGWCGTEGVFLMEGVSRESAEGKKCSCWEQSRGKVRKRRGVLVGGVFLNKHQTKNKNQDRQINKDIKMRMFCNVELHRTVSSFRRFYGP
jgi:hypothetical protein